MSATEKPSLKIVFLREGKDRDIFLDVLGERSQTKLILLLEQKWNDFLIAYAAAERDREFSGLLQNLRLPWEREFAVGWLVRWQICPMAGRPVSPMPPAEAFVVQVLQLKRSSPPRYVRRRSAL